MNRLIFIVTNDLAHDQRMERICTSLSNVGYSVSLIGRKTKTSLPLSQKSYEQKRIPVLFTKGKSFYIEYNFKLFFYLLFTKMDLLTAIDLDTILPSFFISRLKNVKRVYDAHELFTEMKEVISRPLIHKLWKAVEKFAVPRFKNGYTVSDSIGQEFEKQYGVNYITIRNVPVFEESTNHYPRNKILVYTGAVNEGRGFEGLVPAMREVNSRLYIYGDGNFIPQCRELINRYELKDKVILKSKLKPQQLRKICREAWIGINLVEPVGKNQLFSLANKFFDYIHADLPQVSMNFPEYKKVNDQFEIAVLVEGLAEKEISAGINRLLADEELYERLKNNCSKAKKEYNWQSEEIKLISFYQRLLP